MLMHNANADVKCLSASMRMIWLSFNSLFLLLLSIIKSTTTRLGSRARSRSLSLVRACSLVFSRVRVFTLSQVCIHLSRSLST